MSDTPKILVIGGAGYIGSHACKALHRAGFDPVVFDNLSTGHPDAVRWGPLIEGDIGDFDALEAAFSEVRPVGLMHFAALTAVGESVTDPYGFYANNVAGSLNVFQAARLAGVDKVVFSSTAAVYQGGQDGLIDEETTLAPGNPYGWSKLMIEQLLADFDRAYDMRSVCLRYFNAAGADPDGEIGEYRSVQTHLIPLAIKAAQGYQELSVFGTDYPTPDGTAVRDYIHVTDLANAHVRAFEHLQAGGQSLRVNLGTGRGFSVREVIEAVERVTGCPVSRREVGRREGDPVRLIADPKRAKTILGFETPHSEDLDALIGSAWRWAQSLELRRKVPMSQEVG